jgi:Spy/CpxP family protein refolding chaperone
METYKKNRLIFWVLILLVAVNLAALAGFFIYSGKSGEAACSQPQTRSCSGLCRELNLSEEQAKKVEVINRDYQSNAAHYAARIKDLRARILDELNLETPDTTVIRKMVQEILIHQGMLQQENIRQYLELKKVCTPEQARQLSGLYRELYGCPMDGKRVQNRYRHGGQKGGPGCE